MTIAELSLCLASALCSSLSQLFLKSAALKPQLAQSLLPVGFGGAFQLASILLAVTALQTLQLSQLIPFAAIAYLLVPMGGSIIFGDRLLPRFKVGAMFIVAGIIVTVI